MQGLVQDAHMRRHTVVALILVVTAVGVPLAGPASAATVSVELPSTLVYAAAAGEINALDVRMEGSLVVFHDAGAIIALGEFTQACSPRDESTVACDAGQFQRSVRAELRDGEDRGTLDLPLMASLQGGDGNDTLTVSTSTPALVPVQALGQAGNDTLAVGSGQVLLYGGPGDDGLAASPQGGSLLHGDTGEDRLMGGAGPDSLAGDDGADVIVGGEGDDHIFGDYFAGFGPSDHGPDKVDAGSGSDTVDAGGGIDIVTGGPGGDTVTGGLGNDRLEGGMTTTNWMAPPATTRSAGTPAATRSAAPTALTRRRAGPAATCFSVASTAIG